MSDQRWAEQLTAALDAKKMSKRQLWLALARERDLPETSAKSNVMKWFRGSRPRGENRRALEKILGTRLRPESLEDRLEAVEAEVETLAIAQKTTLAALTARVAGVEARQEQGPRRTNSGANGQT